MVDRREKSSGRLPVCGSRSGRSTSAPRPPRLSPCVAAAPLTCRAPPSSPSSAPTPDPLNPLPPPPPPPPPPPSPSGPLVPLRPTSARVRHPATSRALPRPRRSSRAPPRPSAQAPPPRPARRLDSLSGRQHPQGAAAFDPRVWEPNCTRARGQWKSSRLLPFFQPYSHRYGLRFAPSPFPRPTGVSKFEPLIFLQNSTLSTHRDHHLLVHRGRPESGGWTPAGFF